MDDVSAWLAIPALLVAVAWAGLMYIYERGRYPDSLDALSDRPVLLTTLVLGFAVPVFVGIYFAPVIATVVVAGMIGTGLGHTCYRVVYGFVRPAPEGTIDRLGERYA